MLLASSSTIKVRFIAHSKVFRNQSQNWQDWVVAIWDDGKGSKAIIILFTQRDFELDLAGQALFRALPAREHEWLLRRYQWHGILSGCLFSNRCLRVIDRVLLWPAAVFQWVLGAQRFVACDGSDWVQYARDSAAVEAHAQHGEAAVLRLSAQGQREQAVTEGVCEGQPVSEWPLYLRGLAHPL